LSLAYLEEAIGAWNETRWADPEFATLLREAEATLDIEARREIVGQIQDIMQSRGPIGNWNITHERFQNVTAHPTAYDELYDVWEAEA
jgi:peptide/nickel transport system substrate-binding protein